ncbi:hypothetical protein ABT278_29580 [Streptomyces sp. NPDC001228]|uniref:hypothetical protein n=1 Tax=Streptomyces sp. NPDC001228 TaxID=3154381 RepID=UPI0033329CA4
MSGRCAGRLTAAPGGRPARPPTRTRPSTPPAGPVCRPDSGLGTSLLDAVTVLIDWAGSHHDEICANRVRYDEAREEQPSSVTTKTGTAASPRQAAGRPSAGTR